MTDLDPRALCKAFGSFMTGVTAPSQVADRTLLFERAQRHVADAEQCETNVFSERS